MNNGADQRASSQKYSDNKFEKRLQYRNFPQLEEYPILALKLS